MMQLLRITVFQFLKKLKRELLHDSALPPLRKLKHMSTQKVAHAMFIAALFMTAKKWRQFICPLTNKWINKLWHCHTMEYHLAIKRNEV